MTYCLMIFLIISFLILYIFINNKKSNEKTRKMINDIWAKHPGKEINEGDFASISSYYENLQSSPDERICIDNITWNDLDMNKIFCTINNTLSAVGEEYLYNLIRCPVFDKCKLEKRSKLISLFQKNKEVRQSVQFILAKLGKIRHLNVSDFFCSIDNTKYKGKKRYLFLASLLAISTVVIFFNAGIGVLACALMFFINATVYYKVKNSIEHKFIPLSYIVQMISTANLITKLNIPEISEYQRKLNVSVLKLKKVNKKAFRVLYKAQDPLIEYVRVLFFLELIAFENTNNFLAENREEIRNIYEILGQLDAMISIASYREYANFYCEPVFIEHKPESGLEVKAVDLFHPLLKEPKTYSFDFIKPVLITGSNASGKSTFLKSVAINAILAQTISTCLAKEFHLSNFMIYTSMALKDNVENKESYFIAELKSLKRIIDAVDAGIPCLCVVDEVLRGTNTIERIAASSEVLNSLNSKNCICLAATHDIELTTILEDVFENYHFREEVTEANDVVFNYTLYPGRSSTKNALKLLKIMGYNKCTVKRAQDRSDKFVNEGVWEKVNAL